jgi:hypothetical protein
MTRDDEQAAITDKLAIVRVSKRRYAVAQRTSVAMTAIDGGPLIPVANYQLLTEPLSYVAALEKLRILR